MLIKIITIFLIGIAVLAMFGRLRLPKLKNPLRRDGQLNASKCKKCGINRHIYLLVDAEDGSGKVCKDKKSCDAKSQSGKTQKQETELSGLSAG